MSLRTSAGGIKQRVVSGFLANALGRFWVIAVQLLSVPILTATWGASGYGVWLMLTAVPTYLALSDFGFGATASVEMMKRLGVGDREGANAVFQSTWTLITGIVFSAVLIFAALWALFHLHILGLGRMTPEVANTAMIMGIYSLASVQMVILNNGFRSTGRYAQGTLLLELQIPLESLAVVVTASLGGHLWQAASAMLAIRALGLANYMRVLKRAEPWLSIGWKDASASEIKALARPALAAFNITLSQALTIQGVILTLGLFASPAAAAAFGAARMLMRAPLQLINLMTRATLPELTAAHASHDEAKIIRLTLVNLVFSPLIFVPCGVALVLFGPWVLRILSHGRLHVEPVIFWWFALTLIFQGVWNVLAQSFLAKNRQQLFSHWYTLLALGVVASPALGPHAGAIGRTAMASCLAEVTMTAVVFHMWRSEHPFTLADFHRSWRDMDVLSTVRNLRGGPAR